MPPDRLGPHSAGQQLLQGVGQPGAHQHLRLQTRDHVAQARAGLGQVAAHGRQLRRHRRVGAGQPPPKRRDPQRQRGEDLHRVVVQPAGDPLALGVLDGEELVQHVLLLQHPRVLGRLRPPGVADVDRDADHRAHRGRRRRAPAAATPRTGCCPARSRCSCRPRRARARREVVGRHRVVGVARHDVLADELAGRQPDPGQGRARRVGADAVGVEDVHDHRAAGHQQLEQRRRPPSPTEPRRHDGVASSSPSRVATASASSLECTPSLPSRFATWLRTVLTLSHSRWAIAALLSPSASRPEHLELARGEVGAEPGLGPSVHPAHQPREQRRAEHRLTRRGAADRLDQLVDGARLLHEPGAAVLHRLEQRVVVGRRREHDDLGRRREPLEVGDGRDAAAVGQTLVEQHDVDAAVRDPLAGRGQVGRGPDDHEVGLDLERGRHAAREHDVVVDQQHPDGAVRLVHLGSSPPPVHHTHPRSTGDGPTVVLRRPPCRTSRRFVLVRSHQCRPVRPDLPPRRVTADDGRVPATPPDPRAIRVVRRATTTRACSRPPGTRCGRTPTSTSSPRSPTATTCARSWRANRSTSWSPTSGCRAGGSDLVRYLRAMTPPPGVVVVTARDDPATCLELVQAGSRCIVSKYGVDVDLGRCVVRCHHGDVVLVGAGPAAVLDHLLERAARAPLTIAGRGGACAPRQDRTSAPGRPPPPLVRWSRPGGLSPRRWTVAAPPSMATTLRRPRVALPPAPRGRLRRGQAAADAGQPAPVQRRGRDGRAAWIG